MITVFTSGSIGWADATAKKDPLDERNPGVVIHEKRFEGHIPAGRKSAPARITGEDGNQRPSGPQPERRFLPVWESDR